MEATREQVLSYYDSLTPGQKLLVFQRMLERMQEIEEIRFSPEYGFYWDGSGEPIFE